MPALPFTVPIATGGAFEVSSPAERVYLLTFASPPDNRLTPAFIEAWLLALDIVEYTLPRGVVVSTSAIPKFYSNGLNLEEAVATPGFFKNYLYRLFDRLLTYPMPTVALFNGHAFAGGFMVGMYHDYRFQNPSKGFLCLNEILFGAVMTPGMVTIFREKIPGAQTFRDIVLEAKRYPGPASLQAGIVDGLGDLADVLRFIAARDLTTKGDAGVYGGNRAGMYPDSFRILRSPDEDAGIGGPDALTDPLAKDAALARIEKWAAAAKAKAHL